MLSFMHRFQYIAQVLKCSIIHYDLYLSII